jgi:WD40 repeat protein
LVSGDALYQTTRQDEIQLFYSPTKETLYGLTASGGVYLYNSATGNEIDSRPAPITFSETGFSGAYDYHQDSASLALGLEDGDIIVWDLIEGEEPQRLTHTDTASRVIDLDFSSNGESLAAVYGVEQNYRISLWNWREGTRMLDVASPPSENRAVSEIAFSHDGRYLSGLALDTIITWDASTGEILHSVPDALRGDSLLFRFIPDTSLLLVGGVESNILLLDVDQGVTIATLPNTGGNPQSIAPIGAAVSPDVQMMLTTKLDEPVALWNLSNLANGNIARNAQPFGSPSIFDVLWTEDSFAVLMIDARGPVEVWGIP